MRVELRVASNSTNKLASRDYVRRHLRVDNRVEDDLIDSYVQVATRLAENYANRSFLTKSYTLTLAQNQTRLGGYTGYGNLALPYGFYPNFYLNPLSIVLPYGPVQSVTTITSGNWDDTPATLTELEDFFVQADTGQLVVTGIGGNGYNFGVSDYMSITYAAGYGDTAAEVPPDLVHAVMLITANLYINRGDDQDKDVLSPGARSLLDSYRQTTLGTFYG